MSKVKPRRANTVPTKQKRIEELEEKLLIARSALASYCNMSVDDFADDDGWEACEALGATRE